MKRLLTASNQRQIMVLLPILIVVGAIALAVPLGIYLTWIMEGRYRPPGWLLWLERRADTGPQNWKQYVLALLLFNTVVFVVTYLLLALQKVLPLNPTDRGML